jgi:iron complex outermembrane receptor protein
VKDFNGDYTDIPGYSKWVASLTAFYEAGGFNVRGSMRYRSGYLGDFALYSGGLDRQVVQPETVFDAQVGYDFAEGSMLHGLSLYLQGQNLTDEESKTLPQGASNDLQFLKYQTYGRRFLAGFTYKFGAERAAPPPPPPALPPPPPPPAPATQTCPDGSVVLATDACPMPPPPPPPPPPAPERG